MGGQFELKLDGHFTPNRVVTLDRKDVVNLTVFSTNTRYLSKIIATYRKKKSGKYINDLKIDYLINLLKENKKIQKYSNKALSDEAGFSSAERFGKAFYSRAGMPTSYFIKELKRELL